MLTEHKRVKHGELPGDISRGHIIALREHRTLQAPEGFCLSIFPWQHLDETDAKGLRRGMKRKSKAVQRRRDRRAIARGLDGLSPS